MADPMQDLCLSGEAAEGHKKYLMALLFWQLNSSFTSKKQICKKERGLPTLCPGDSNFCTSEYNSSHVTPDIG